jgi:hypothetical protein
LDRELSGHFVLTLDRELSGSFSPLSRREAMYTFVVTGKNVALGVFPSMEFAQASIVLTDPEAVQLEAGEWHAVYWSPKARTNLGIVAVRPTPIPCVLFSDEPRPSRACVRVSRN